MTIFQIFHEMGPNNWKVTEIQYSDVIGEYGETIAYMEDSRESNIVKLISKDGVWAGDIFIPPHRIYYVKIKEEKGA